VRRAARPWWTYLISDGAGRVKIGKTRGSPIRRLKQLQTGTADQLVLLMAVPRDCERELHRRWQHLKINREWYRLSAGIQLFVKAVTENQSVVSPDLKKHNRQGIYGSGKKKIDEDSHGCPHGRNFNA
jgi:hypothetical protein